jgi:DcmR-like sensory protein
MPSSSRDDFIDIAGARLGRHRHACAFFSSRDEEYETLLPFVCDGIRRGEKAFHIVDPKLSEDHQGRLTRAGIDVPGLSSKGQLEVRGWEQAYLRDGHFDQDRMLALIQEVLESGRDRYPLTRLVAHMEWALTDRPNVADIVQYESRLNHVLPNYDDPVICTYDTSKFGGDMIVAMMRTHPVIIVGGVLHENPFYTPPDEFLKELERKRSAKPYA